MGNEESKGGGKSLPGGVVEGLAAVAMCCAVGLYQTLRSKQQKLYRTEGALKETKMQLRETREELQSMSSSLSSKSAELAQSKSMVSHLTGEVGSSKSQLELLQRGHAQSLKTLEACRRELQNRDLELRSKNYSDY